MKREVEALLDEDDLAKALAAIEEFKQDELPIFKYEPKVE